MFEILQTRNKYLSNASIFHLGLSLLNILELIHSSGLVYNDLKPDNILIGYGQSLSNCSFKSTENIFANVDLHLIDFGLASKWRDPTTQTHKKQQDSSHFEGNLYFCSLTQLSLQRTSRRDDLHSLIYLLIFLLNRCSLPCLESAAVNIAQEDLTGKFWKVRELKARYSLASMCTGRALAI